MIGPDKMAPSMAAVDAALRRETILVTWISRCAVEFLWSLDFFPLVPRDRGPLLSNLQSYLTGHLSRRQHVRYSRVTIAFASSRSLSTAMPAIDGRVVMIPNFLDPILDSDSELQLESVNLGQNIAVWSRFLGWNQFSKIVTILGVPIPEKT